MQMNLILVLLKPKNATITFATIATVSNAAVYRYIDYDVIMTSFS